MNPNAMRGTIVVAVLVIIGAVLLGLTDRSGVPSAATPIETPTPEVVVEEVPAEVIATPTPASAALERSPAQVTVQVANASGIAGVAGRLTQRLAGAGYSTAAATNGTNAIESTIFYVEGYEADATAIATKVFELPELTVAPLPEPPPAVDNLDLTANIVIVVANDTLASA